MKLDNGDQKTYWADHYLVYPTQNNMTSNNFCTLFTSSNGSPCDLQATGKNALITVDDHESIFVSDDIDDSDLDTLYTIVNAVFINCNGCIILLRQAADVKDLLPGNQGLQFSDTIEEENAAFEFYKFIHSAAAVSKYATTALIHINTLKNAINERWDIVNNWDLIDVNTSI